jgi:hypothetical protein
VSVSSFTAAPLATSIAHSARWLSSSSSCLPSGDHTGAKKKAFDGNAIARGLLTPVCSAIIS